MDLILAESTECLEYWLRVDKDWVNDRLENIRNLTRPWNSINETIKEENDIEPLEFESEQEEIESKNEKLYVS